MTETVLPRVDIITVNYNNRPFLDEFFRALSLTAYPPERMRLFFVDNASRDGSLECAAGRRLEMPVILVENRRNLGFARANNLAFARSDAEFIALLNSDTRPEPGWLAGLVKAMQSDPGAGIASCARLPLEADRFIETQTGYCSWCSGGHSLIRRSALDRTGYFDEAFFMYAEDVDLSWRMWLHGFHCLYVPQARCEHHFGKPEQYRTRRLYYHVRNALLLRYAYGSAALIAAELHKRIRDAARLLVRSGSPGQSWAVIAALLAHLLLIPHFLRRRAFIAAALRKQPHLRKWIRFI